MLQCFSAGPILAWLIHTLSGSDGAIAAAGFFYQQVLIAHVVPDQLFFYQQVLIAHVVPDQ